MEKKRKGWGWPGLAKKAHYFVDSMSLCFAITGHFPVRS